MPPMATRVPELREVIPFLQSVPAGILKASAALVKLTVRMLRWSGAEDGNCAAVAQTSSFANAALVQLPSGISTSPRSTLRSGALSPTPSSRVCVHMPGAQDATPDTEPRSRAFSLTPRSCVSCYMPKTEDEATLATKQQSRALTPTPRSCVSFHMPETEDYAMPDTRSPFAKRLCATDRLTMSSLYPSLNHCTIDRAVNIDAETFSPKIRRTCSNTCMTSMASQDGDSEAVVQDSSFANVALTPKTTSTVMQLPSSISRCPRSTPQGEPLTATQCSRVSFHMSEPAAGDNATLDPRSPPNTRSTVMQLPSGILRSSQAMPRSQGLIPTPHSCVSFHMPETDGDAATFTTPRSRALTPTPRSCVLFHTSGKEVDAPPDTKPRSRVSTQTPRSRVSFHMSETEDNSTLDKKPRNTALASATHSGVPSHMPKTEDDATPDPTSPFGKRLSAADQKTFSSLYRSLNHCIIDRAVDIDSEVFGPKIRRTCSKASMTTGSTPVTLQSVAFSPTPSSHVSAHTPETEGYATPDTKPQTRALTPTPHPYVSCHMPDAEDDATPDPRSPFGKRLSATDRVTFGSLYRSINHCLVDRRAVDIDSEFTTQKMQRTPKIRATWCGNPRSVRHGTKCGFKHHCIVDRAVDIDSEFTTQKMRRTPKIRATWCASLNQCKA